MRRAPIAALLAALLLVHCAHAPAPPPPRVHVVAPGDTPAAIARRYGVELSALLQLNHIEDPRRLAVGARLLLPVPAEMAPRAEPLEARVDPPRIDPPPADPARADPPPVEPSAGTPPPSEPVRELLPTPAPPEPDVTPAILPAPPPGDLEAMRETFARSKKAGQSAFIWPVDGVVTSLFGARGGARHDGIDIGAPHGSAVWAAADGKVLYAGEQKGYGLIVLLAHEGGVVTVYAHNAANLVKTGDRVEQGDPIAQVGQSGGQRSPALHFELRRDKKPENPLAVLPP